MIFIIKQINKNNKNNKNKMETIFLTENNHKVFKSTPFQLPCNIKDTRCSSRCTQNWTKFGQTPPIGHYCSCCLKRK